MQLEFIRLIIFWVPSETNKTKQNAAYYLKES